jgi:uncharacterized protein
MKLDLRTLEDLPARVTLSEDAGMLNDGLMDMELTGTVTADFDVVPGDHIYYCQGRVVSAARLQCARCLELFTVTLRGEIDFSINEVADEDAVDRDKIPDNELLVPAGVGDVDISAPIREALVLELPLKPLCRADCRGLCAVCGINRNEQVCDCKIDEIDSRWDALRDLLK